MAPKPDDAEGIVLSFVNEQNRPLNSQNVADALQKHGLKKTAVQKALDALADSGQISFKEYGKQKIYLAKQDQFSIPNNEELDRMKKENGKLQEQKKEANQIEVEIRSLQSNLTLEEIRSKETQLKMEVSQMESKLSKLRQGTALVNPEDKKKVEASYVAKINLWRQRKSIFKDLWNMLTENMPKDLKEFKEELGIEYDEDVGVDFESWCGLLVQNKKQEVRVSSFYRFSLCLQAMLSRYRVHLMGDYLYETPLTLGLVLKPSYHG